MERNIRFNAPENSSILQRCNKLSRSSKQFVENPTFPSKPFDGGLEEDYFIWNFETRLSYFHSQELFASCSADGYKSMDFLRWVKRLSSKQTKWSTCWMRDQQVWNGPLYIYWWKSSMHLLCIQQKMYFLKQAIKSPQTGNQASKYPVVYFAVNAHGRC